MSYRRVAVGNLRKLAISSESRPDLPFFGPLVCLPRFQFKLRLFLSPHNVAAIGCFCFFVCRMGNKPARLAPEEPAPLQKYESESGDELQVSFNISSLFFFSF